MSPLLEFNLVKLNITMKFFWEQIDRKWIRNDREAK